MLEEDNYARERQRDEADKEEESFVQCFNGVGEWMPFVGKLEAGALIQIDTDLLSLDKLRINLDRGARGRVLRIDEDGDALIQFFSLPELGTSSRWVEKTTFQRLLLWHVGDMNRWAAIPDLVD